MIGNKDYLYDGEKHPLYHGIGRKCPKEELWEPSASWPALFAYGSRCSFSPVGSSRSIAVPVFLLQAMVL